MAGAVLKIEKKTKQSSYGNLPRSEQEALFEKFFDVAHIIFVALNHEGKIFLINPAGCRILGRTESDLIGQDWFTTCLPAQGRDKVKNVFNQLMTGEYEAIEYYENTIITPDGTQRSIAWHNALLHDETDRKVKGTISAGIDITDKKLAEDALLRSEDKYRALSEATFEGVAIHENGVIADLNTAFASMFGYKTPELIGKPVLELAAVQSRDRVKNNLLSKNEEPYEAIGVRKDGTRFYGELRSKNVKYRNKSVRVTAIRDISERRRSEEHRIRLEQQVLQTQKLESLGTMAGGIAHDFNNLLTGILSNTDLASLECQPTSPVHYYLGQIKNAASQLSSLTRQMLDYAGKGKSAYGPVNLSELIHNTKQLLLASVPKKTKLEFDLLPNLPPVQADHNQIRQVIINLVNNAVESIGNHEGTVSIRTTTMEATHDQLAHAVSNESLPEGTYVALEVSDTGCGIKPEDQSKVFDPFFTTKFTGRGLGLATVLGIVRGHHGTVSLKSEPACGSTFRLLLPLAEPIALQSRDNRHATGIESKKDKAILVVDDEETVRKVVKIMLEKVGFRVWTAGDGIEALKTIAKHPDEIGAVILDLTMPKMDGIETYQQIRAINEDIPVILSSGYSQVDALAQLNDKGLAGFIQKPYDHATLLEKIIELLKT